MAGDTKRSLTVWAPIAALEPTTRTDKNKSMEREYIVILSDDKIRFIWCKLQNQIEVYKPGFYVVLPKKRTS